MEFLDRTEERARLERFLSVEEGAMACLYGRRRIGKSRLLDEVLGGRRDVVLYCADQSEASLQRARMAEDFSRLIIGLADSEYLDWRRFFERWQRDAPKGSVMVIDELPYLIEKSPELPSVLQKIADDLRKTGQKIIICGSSQRMMQGLVLDEKEPLYGRCRVIMKLEPIAYGWLKKAFPKESAFSRFANYAVLGGVPRYWEVCCDCGNLRAMMRDEIFSYQGLFHGEPSFVLKDDLDGAAQAASVLSLIGGGAERPAEMASRLQLPQTALGRPLKRLLDLGLIYRDIPFGAEAKGNKKALYKIADPFLRFWYAFVLPHYSDKSFLGKKQDAEMFERPFRVFLGQAWEKLVRDNLVNHRLADVDCDWRKVGRWWGTGINRQPMEVDIVAESHDGKTLLVGEAKLKLTKKEYEHELAELKVKAKLLPFAKDYEQVVVKMFVAQGGELGCVDLNWVEDANK